MLSAKIYFHNLNFILPSGTSRGILKNKPTWFIKIFKTNSPETFGIGECGPIDGLSLDNLSEIPHKLKLITENINDLSNIDLSLFPSIQFALENAFKDLDNGGKRIIFRNSFLKGFPIKINGLIWMGSKEFMLTQVKKKLDEGFSCLKLKIGAINFDDEIKIIEKIRNQFSSEILEIRVDANGAFNSKNVFDKLKQLDKFKIHSIEQPIGVSKWKEMREICKYSPIPIVLDEELIHIKEKHQELLDYINPHYLVLKPTLLGGFKSTQKWINTANDNKTKWWITSALESNIGLNAISQLCAEYDLELPQGLGTGQLFENNIVSPLTVNGEKISYQKNMKWDLSIFK